MTMTPRQLRETEKRHAAEEKRIIELLRPFLADGVDIAAPHIPAGDGITLTHPDGSVVELKPIGDYATFLEVAGSGPIIRYVDPMAAPNCRCVIVPADQSMSDTPFKGR